MRIQNSRTDSVCFYPSTYFLSFYGIVWFATHKRYLSLGSWKRFPPFFEWISGSEWLFQSSLRRQPQQYRLTGWDCGEPSWHGFSHPIITVTGSHLLSLAVASGLCTQSLGTACTPFAFVWLFVFAALPTVPYLTVLTPSLTLNFTCFLPRTMALLPSPFPYLQVYLLSPNPSVLSGGFLL